MLDCLDELEELMVKTNESMDKVIEWMIEHKNDALFETNEGKELNKHICDMGMNHAFIYGDIATLLLKDFNEEMKRHREKSYKGS